MGAVEHLADADKDLVLKLMARAAEQSYRRGVQHGVELIRRGHKAATIRRAELIARPAMRLAL